MKKTGLFVLCILLLFSGCANLVNPPSNETTSQPTATDAPPAPYYTTFNSPFLDETDETLLVLLNEADEMLDSEETITINKQPYLDYLFVYASVMDGELRDGGSQYIIQFSGSDSSRDYLQFMVFVSLLAERYSDCFVYENLRTYNFEYRNLLFCEHYQQAGYDTVEEYIEENGPTHTIDLMRLAINKHLNYEYHDIPLFVDLTDLPNSLPKHYEISSTPHYAVIRRHLNYYIDFHGQLQSGTDTDEPPTPITRASYEELKNSILSGSFTEAELLTIQSFLKNDHEDIFLFNIEKEYIPQMPDGLDVESVSWNGRDIVFNLSGNGITGYMTFENSAYYPLDAYHHFEYEGHPDYFCNKYFNYEAGSIYILECYQRSVSETVPIYVRFWNVGGGYSYGYLTGFTEPPTKEWLYSLGLK